MQVVEIQGRNMREALENARSNLGDQALVVSQRELDGGGVALAVSTNVPHNSSDLTLLRDQAERVLDEGSRQAPSPAPELTRDVQRALAAAGASQNLIDRICEAVAGRAAEGLHPLDLAAEEIGAVFPIAQAKVSRDKTTVFTFLGHAGVGKTTTIAKLAARLVRAGRRVALATLDTKRVGGREQLQAFGELLGVPAVAFDDVKLGLKGLAQMGRFDVILLDTSGTLERDVAAISELVELIERYKLPMTLDAYLVLSAISSEDAMNQVIERCAGLEPAGCVLTKLDETSAPGPVLEHTLQAKLAVAFLNNGPELAPHFHRPAPALFADLLLRGKIS
jgi:flagellar biosynthesis protein FlhF